jgi:hypothetical protein
LYVESKTNKIKAIDNYLSLLDLAQSFQPSGSTEIDDRQAKGLCFECDEKFTSDHKEDCKRLFAIKLLDEADPMISIHALTGI